ncbi:helix-turn-helix transcriptional regulator [Bradyrhizobium sp. U87765 SZCCT0131]|uniref:AraC family transcriptional regulator n=1 Tax=unclassified Bradyrhizobium TaxID=2631580 RepID=UPI001BA827BA|nr:MULTISPECIES: helix-turn-helix transcriptional regulator [unclassified Bradyrhizobium]MBR1222945.1 helix-turn-helix transcriptional regulator [Bradyrhizobium sp. U87765 SZCCT0131]MBR1262681.1 helix-turn-helix transcriptional regulator [Bradyrhizobium sp. U87765 SZCCT0134]MBR1308847.1 helix-turn-helix transcriptional regulator [Bradyrhizobium sp. U87765 SZCCT0110]MBR1318463.1 helix-turn-helix transcriptional regulator [Bradyrhizobium sp. U87765 SZCCT0109]MBR1352167.1 helix-turn-helix transcr
MPFYRLNEDDLRPDDADGFDPEGVPRAITAFGADISTRGMELGLHVHRKAEVILTMRGIVRCEADRSAWIVPPRCAVWIPGNRPHSVTFSGHVEVYCVFIEPEVVPTLPGQCCGLSVSPLLERLLLHAATIPVLYDIDGADGRIATVLLDQLARASVEMLNFPMPANAKLRNIAAAMMAEPSDRATIADWGKRMAIAPRTLTRMLQRETGMSFGRWRQQLHILIALQRLAGGASVQAVALDLGYEGASAFVTMFRKALGKPPARYLAERGAAV